MLQLERCHTMNFDTARRGEMGYHGEKLPFYARRALMLPGNGTSVLEAQDPAGNAPHITWREVRPPAPLPWNPPPPPTHPALASLSASVSGGCGLPWRRAGCA